MVAVHDGTANINKRNVINVKCVNCKHCIGFEDGYYICRGLWWEGEIEAVDECIANDDKMKCDLYEQDSDDDTSA